MSVPDSKPVVEHISGKSISDLLVAILPDQGRPALNIPDYQRGYCWGKKQVEGLLESIWYFDWKDAKKLHLGTVIVHEREDAGDIVWDIVDGQQRLITLSILFAVATKQPLDYYSLLKCKTDDEDVLKHVRWAAMTIKDWIGNHPSVNTDANTDTKEIFGQITVDVIVIKGENKLQLAYTFFNAVNSAGKNFPITIC